MCLEDERSEVNFDNHMMQHFCLKKFIYMFKLNLNLICIIYTRANGNYNIRYLN